MSVPFLSGQTQTFATSAKPYAVYANAVEENISPKSIISQGDLYLYERGENCVPHILYKKKKEAKLMKEHRN